MTDVRVRNVRRLGRRAAPQPGEARRTQPGEQLRAASSPTPPGPRSKPWPPSCAGVKGLHDKYGDVFGQHHRHPCRAGRAMIVIDANVAVKWYYPRTEPKPPSNSRPAATG